MRRLAALLLAALPAAAQISIPAAPCSMTDGSCAGGSSASYATLTPPATCTTAGMLPIFLGSPLALGCDAGITYDATNKKLVLNRIGYNPYTTAQRDALTATAADGIYNSTTGRWEIYDGGAWHGRVRLDGDTMTGDLTVTKGTGTATGKVSNVLNVNTTTQATTGTSEQVLATYTLPANTLNVNGKAVRVTVWGTSAANSNPKVYRIYLGSTIVAGSTNNVSGWKWMAVATIVRTGASAEVSNAFTQHGATGWVDHIALSENTATDLAITMKATTATATGDLTFQGMIVEALN